MNRTPPGHRATGLVWKALVLVVCLFVGALLATTRGVSAGNELRSGDTTRLSDLVRAAQASSDDAEQTRNGLAAQVDLLQRTAAGSDADVADTIARTDPLADAAGLDPASGSGVVVTMTDAPRGPDGKYASDASPNDLVVHQVDVQSALNALWAGGASAIGMQDQRLVSSSAPRCIGNTLLLGGRTYSPPYVMTAVGDPARLQAALDNEPGVRLFRQYAVRYGLGYDARSQDTVSVPGYTGAVRMRFAQPR